MRQDKYIYRTKNGTIITPYRKYQCRDLEKSTSTYDKVYHRSRELTGFMIKNYQNGADAFMTHYIPEDYLVANFRNYQICDIQQGRCCDIKYDFDLNPNITLKEVQGQVANEVISSTKSYKEWFINLQTGVGKTVLGMYLSAKFHKKTMIICFMTGILDQWKGAYADKTTIDPDRVFEIPSSKWLEKIYRNCEGDDDHDIYLISTSLITSFLNNHPIHQFTTIVNDLGIGLMIFDEGHRNMSTIVKVNALTNVKYTLYLSADYSQGDYMREKLFYRIFRKTKIIKPDEETAKSLKHTKVIVVDYDSHPGVTDSTSIYNKYGFSAEYYMDYQLRKGMILQVLDSLMKMISDSRKPEYKTLILLEHIKHVDIIYDHLKNLSGFTIGKYHSHLSDEERTNTRENADVIISTYKSFGVGMDLESIKYVISLNQCNKVIANQAAGRSRPLPDGTDSIFFMVTDYGFKYCKQKTRVVLQYLSEQKLKEPPFAFHIM